MSLHKKGERASVDSSFLIKISLRMAFPPCHVTIDRIIGVLAAHSHGTASVGYCRVLPQRTAFVEAYLFK